jgi:hypothetical protein
VFGLPEVKRGLITAAGGLVAVNDSSEDHAAVTRATLESRGPAEGARAFLGRLRPSWTGSFASGDAELNATQPAEDTANGDART